MTTPIVFGAGLGVMALWWRHRYRQPTVDLPTATTGAHTHMAPAIRAELDDRPEFWDDRFHRLLAAVGAKTVVGETWEFRTWSDAVAYEYAEVGYVDCPCSKCRRICHG